MNEADDRALVRRFLDGDPKAFEVLIDRYQRPIYNIALRISNDREDARDIAQTAFVKACENLRSYDPTFKFFSWLYRIAINEALNVVEQRRSQTDLDSKIIAPGRKPDEQYDHDQLRVRVRRAVMALPSEYRDVVALRHFGGLSYREVGHALSLPEKTVKSRLFTARRILRDELAASRSEQT